MRVNDLGGSAQDVLGPGAMGAAVVISRVIYQGGRRRWRVTFAEATIVAMCTGTIGPVLHALGISQDLSYPLAVFVGYVGIDRFSIYVCKKLGVD